MAGSLLARTSGASARAKEIGHTSAVNRISVKQVRSRAMQGSPRVLPLRVAPLLVLAFKCTCTAIKRRSPGYQRRPKGQSILGLSVSAPADHQCPDLSGTRSKGTSMK